MNSIYYLFHDANFKRLQNLGSYIIKPLIDLFYPPVCIFCTSYLENKRKIICSACWKKLIKFGPIIINKHKNAVIDKVYILFKFEDHIRPLIHLFKYNHYLSLAKYFSDEIIRTYPLLHKNTYQYIIPVPLHPARLRERGYNQSHILAAHLSSCLHIPVLDHALIRTRNTISQTKLNNKQRRENVLNAFKCSYPLKDSSILLVDDIITTGNTLKECTSVLKSAGVKKVDLLALAGLAKTVFY